MFKRFSARKMIGFSPDQLAALLKGRFFLVFDDGELFTTARETIYSSVFWIFHQQNPSMPMKKSHHVRNYLGTFEPEDREWKTQKYYNSKSHIDIGNAGLS